MNEKLAKEAEALGINVSMYNILPPNKREEALRKDVEKQKKQSANRT